MVTNNESKRRFELQQDEGTSVADYVPAEGVLTITHVVVPVALRGRGIASQLAQGVVDYAREHSLKLRPVCPFMVTYLERHPEHRDLVID